MNSKFFIDYRYPSAARQPQSVGLAIGLHASDRHEMYRQQVVCPPQLVCGRLARQPGGAEQSTSGRPMEDSRLDMEHDWCRTRSNGKIQTGGSGECASPARDEIRTISIAPGTRHGHGSDQLMCRLRRRWTLRWAPTVQRPPVPSRTPVPRFNSCSKTMARLCSFED